MPKMARWTIPFLLGGAAAASVSLPIRLETRVAVTSRLANIHLSFDRPVDGIIAVTYGSCHSTSLADSHHIIAQADIKTASRLVWILPQDAGSDGCISAWGDSGALVGRSEPQVLHHRYKRRDQKREGIHTWRKLERKRESG
jgi:hypothetical protein